MSAAALLHQAIDALALDPSGVELKEFTIALGRVMEQEGAAAIAETFDAIYRETDDVAKLQLIQTLVTAGSKSVSRSRRQKGGSVKSRSANTPAMQRLLELTAVKTLDSPPPKERVIAIPAEDGGSGRGRILLH